MENQNHNHKLRLYDVYEKIGKLEGTVYQMDKKLDMVINDYGIRINKVETNCDTIKGKAAGIGMVGGFIGAIIGFLISFFKK